MSGTQCLALGHWVPAEETLFSEKPNDAVRVCLESVLVLTLGSTQPRVCASRAALTVSVRQVMFCLLKAKPSVPTT